MSKITVALDDDLERAAEIEAKRSHGGDMSALVGAAVDYYLTVQNGLHRIEDAFKKEMPKDDVVAAAIAADGRYGGDQLAELASRLQAIAKSMPPGK